MKKSELKASIKEEIIEILSEATPEEIEAQKELNAELEKTKELQDDLSEEYAADKFNVNVFGYQTKYYKVCPGAKSFMDKVIWLLPVNTLKLGKNLLIAKNISL